MPYPQDAYVSLNIQFAFVHLAIDILCVFLVVFMLSNRYALSISTSVS